MVSSFFLSLQRACVKKRGDGEVDEFHSMTQRERERERGERERRTERGRRGEEKGREKGRGLGGGRGCIVSQPLNDISAIRLMVYTLVYELR